MIYNIDVYICDRVIIIILQRAFNDSARLIRIYYNIYYYK